MDSWIDLIEPEQVTQNNWLTSVENDIISVNNTLSNLSLNNLTDVDLTTPPTINQILKYDGTKFIADD